MQLENPIEFIETIRPDFKISNTSRKYLTDIYNYICIESFKLEAKPLVIVSARQMELTEMAVNCFLYTFVHRQNIRSIYSAPTQDYIRRFSNNRFRTITQKLSTIKNSVNHKVFENKNEIFFASAYGNCLDFRGISGDFIISDDVECCGQAIFETSSQAIQCSKYKSEVLIGHPRGNINNSRIKCFQNIWEQSDQRYFYLKCIKCQEHFKLTIDLCEEGTNVRCSICDKLQDKKPAISSGQWFATANKPSKYVGFHLNQLLHPNVTIEDVMQRKSWLPDNVFRNEILGEFV